MNKKYFLFIIILTNILCGYFSFSQEKIIVTPSAARFDTISQLQFNDFPRKPKIALVLSGGGSRGIAHLGVLLALEKHHIPIDLIVGTSMGSIIGGLYSSGYTTEEMKNIVDTTQWSQVLSLADQSERENLFLSQKVLADKKQLTMRFDGLSPIIPTALSSGQRLSNFINQLTLQALYHPLTSFDDLKIPFRAVATDLISGKEIVFSSGSLSEALRASFSVPLLYATVKKDSFELTDGGLVSNIPVDIAKEMGADIIIAVDATSPLRTSTQINTAWEVADQIVNIMSQTMKKQLLDSATVVIEPDLGLYPATDFSQLKFVIQQGFNAMEKKINALNDSIEIHRRADYYDSSPLSHFKFVVGSISYKYDGKIPDSIIEKSGIIVSERLTMPLLREKLSLLQSTGWCKKVFAEVQFEDSTAHIVVNLALNPIVQSISINNTNEFSPKTVLQHFDILLHKPFNSLKLRESIDNILSIYRLNGFSLARIQSFFNAETGELKLTINEGVIHQFFLEGKTVTRDWVVWRELPFQEGDIFTVQKAKEALANLYATNLFDQVLMDIRYVDNFPCVVIQMKEKKTELTRIGLRIDNERNLQPTIDIRSENLLGIATEAGFGFAGGLRNRRYILDFKANRIFNTYFTFNINGYYNLRDVNVYSNDPTITSLLRFDRTNIGEFRQLIYGTSFSMGRQVERFGTVLLEYRLEANEVQFLRGIGYTPEDLTLQAFKVSSLIDTQDKFPFARNGSITSLSWETATSTLKKILGTVGYSKIFIAYEWFNSIGVHTIHPKIQFGFGDQTLPFSQQFSWGGEDSFFGLNEDDSRGRQLFLTSLEVRSLLPFKIIWDSYVRMRYDFGNIWPQQENISIRDFHNGIGLGISLDTPIGPANLSVGRSFYIRRDLLDQPLTLGPIIAYFSIGYPIN